MDCNNSVGNLCYINWIGGGIMMKKEIKKYSFAMGVWKTVKNSAYLLIPFAIAVLSGLPMEYAILTGPAVYFLKNYFENRTKKK